MTADRDTTRIVRSWLQTDEHESADRVLDVVLGRLDTTPQRRPVWSVRRFQRMQSITRLAIGAAAVIAVAAVGFTSGIGRPSVAVVQSPSPAPTDTPTAPPTDAPTLAPSPSGGGIPILNGQAEAGRYRVNAALPTSLVVEVPQGWEANGSWVLVGPGGNESPDGMAIRFYRVERVFTDPADASGGFLPGVGPTAADLVGAIVAHPAWDATGPTDITIGGHPGQLVELTIPEDARFNSDGDFNLFVDNDDGRIWGFAPGQKFRLHVVDVGDERLVIEAYSYPETSAADLQAQQAILDSIEISDAP